MYTFEGLDLLKTNSTSRLFSKMSCGLRYHLWIPKEVTQAVTRKASGYSVVVDADWVSAENAYLDKEMGAAWTEERWDEE